MKLWLLGENIGGCHYDMEDKEYLHDMEVNIFLMGNIKEKEW